MLPGYYVVDNIAQPNGSHEVHIQGCAYFPSSITPLGFHTTCQGALRQASRVFEKSIGCALCAPECKYG